MNPSSAADTKRICKFIHEALELLSFQHHSERRKVADLLFVFSCVSCLTLKAPRKPASENVVCCIFLQTFQTYFLHIGKQCGPRSDCS